MEFEETKLKETTFRRYHQRTISKRLTKIFIKLGICILVIQTIKLLYLSRIHYEQDPMPWYFSLSETHNKSKHSGRTQSLSLWPEDEFSDRIKNQLMFLPSSKPSKIMQILMYNGLPFLEGRRSGSIAFADCPIKHCFASTNRSEAQNADAVLFRNVIEEPVFHRPKNQIWIYYTLESPYIAQVNPNSKPINWTATYRIDSDIVAPYGKWFYFDETITEFYGPLRDFTQNKTKMIAWFVSNCKASNKRLEYALELQKYIQVDIYGDCGTYSCPKYEEETCFQKLANEYRFYLAFENSNCKDYISEKFFLNSLGNNIVPIVMGARPQDYKRSAPKNSFIHVEEFSTPKDLADYLKILAENDALYNSYFKWKGTGEVVKPYFYCRLCAMLHSNPPYKSYNNLDQWWNSSGTCTEGFWRDTEDLDKN